MALECIYCGNLIDTVKGKNGMLRLISHLFQITGDISFNVLCLGSCQYGE